MEHYDITIVIPIYQGKKYIQKLTEMLYRNFELFDLEFTGKKEILFINDDPVDRLSITDIPCRTNNVAITVLNLKENCGIHGARVCGLKRAGGEYIVFLDQDDEVTENYIVSQCRIINNQEAVLCNGYIRQYLVSGDRDIYSTVEEQCEAIELATLLHGNHIVSPGQMMIRKSSISEIWKEVILKANGADDYYLWLLMVKEKKQIGINPDKLYIHIGHDSNTSSNREEMCNSKQELFEILYNHKILSSEEYRELIGQQTHKYYRVREILDLYDQWMYLKIRNREISQYLCAREYNIIAIYGMGITGYRLYDDIRRSGIHVLFGIDRDAKKKIYAYDIPIVGLEETLRRFEEVDAVIVTAVADYEMIREQLISKVDIPVLSIKNIFSEMIDEVE